MILRLLIQNNSNGSLPIPHPEAGSKLLKKREVIDFICIDYQFVEYIEKLERIIKQNWILIKLNIAETQNPKSVLRFIQKNSTTIYNSIIKNDPSLTIYTSNSDYEKTILKAFISYSTFDKKIAGKLKNILEKFKITTFLAHEDIEISEEWEKRIIKELKNTNIFIPVLSKNFKESDWASQEVGIIYSRKKLLIIPLSIDSVFPYGFINHIQGKRISEDSIPINFLLTPIIEKYSDALIPRVIDYLKSVAGFRQAEEIMNLLSPYFKEFQNEQIDSFVENCINNKQIILSRGCNRKYIPDFIKINQDRISKKMLNELEKKLASY